MPPKALGSWCLRMRPRFPDGFLEQNLPSMTSSVRGERALGNDTTLLIGYVNYFQCDIHFSCSILCNPEAIPRGEDHYYPH